MTLQTQGLARQTLLEEQIGISYLPNIGMRTRLHLTQIQRGKTLQLSCSAVYRTPCS